MNLKQIVDETWNNISNGKGVGSTDLTKGQFVEFADAFFSDKNRKGSFGGAMIDISEKFASFAILRGWSTPEEAADFITQKPISTPLMAMMYLGFLIGKNAGKAESETNALESMMGSLGDLDV